jgi:RNA polymerase sigma-70 factor (ECF subfamily)
MNEPVRPLQIVREVSAQTHNEPPPVERDVSDALRELIGRFDAFIRRTASRHGLSGSEIDDVVQDLRVRLWRSFGTAELIRRARATYIYRAAVSASLDIVRRRRTTKSSATSLDAVRPEALADSRRSVDERLEGHDLSRAVHESLALLQESRRAVVRMYLAGYHRLEIAEILGWSEARTRNLLYRGLEDLRRILASRGITRDSA